MHCFCIQDTVTKIGTEMHCFAFQSSSYRNRNTDGYTGNIGHETSDPNIERSYNYTNRYRIETLKDHTITQTDTG